MGEWGRQDVCWGKNSFKNRKRVHINLECYSHYSYYVLICSQYSYLLGVAGYTIEP